MRATRRHKPARPGRPQHDATPRVLPAEVVDVLVLSLAEAHANVRRLDDGSVGKLQTPDLRAVVPGLRLTVEYPTRSTSTAKLRAGRILHARLDLDALGLPPRPPLEFDDWRADEALDHLPADIAAELRSRPRRMFEMQEPDRADDALLDGALEHHAAGDRLAAYKLFMRLVERDPGDLDAHLHLGNLAFDLLLPVARSHYEVAVQLGDRDLGPGFADILSWFLHGNRAYLRSLHALGLCHWRAGDFTGAERLFRRMLLLCPEDGIGARFILPAVRARALWDDDDDHDADIPF